MSNPASENVFKIIGNYQLSKYSNDFDKTLTNNTVSNKFHNKFKGSCRIVWFVKDSISFISLNLHLNKSSPMNTATEEQNLFSTPNPCNTRN